MTWSETKAQLLKVGHTGTNGQKANRETKHAAQAWLVTQSPFAVSSPFPHLPLPPGPLSSQTH